MGPYPIGVEVDEIFERMIGVDDVRVGSGGA